MSSIKKVSKYGRYGFYGPALLSGVFFVLVGMIVLMSSCVSETESSRKEQEMGGYSSVSPSSPEVAEAKRVVERFWKENYAGLRIEEFSSASVQGVAGRNIRFNFTCNAIDPDTGQGDEAKDNQTKEDDAAGALVEFSVLVFEPLPGGGIPKVVEIRREGKLVWTMQEK